MPLRSLRSRHLVIASWGCPVLSPEVHSEIRGDAAMKTLIKVLLPLGILAMTGCVFVPARPYHPYYGPRVGVYAPAPVVVVRP
jgi:hypothetical protein